MGAKNFNLFQIIDIVRFAFIVLSKKHASIFPTRIFMGLLSQKNGGKNFKIGGEKRKFNILQGHWCDRPLHCVLVRSVLQISSELKHGRSRKSIFSKYKR